MLKISKKSLAWLMPLLLLAVLIPQYQARADVFGLSSIANSAVEGAVNVVLGIVRSFFLSGISLSANLLDSFIRFQTNNAIYDVGVVNESWTIIRNFVNLFFILVLIIMAFGTIFDIKKYTWREMLAPFLIAALLINFSLAIGQYIITIANGLSNVFLKQIGDVSSNFAEGFKTVKIATSGSTNVLAGASQVIIDGIFSLIFLILVFLTFTAAAIFSLVRLFVLWFLLIISPIAWFGYALPNLKGKTWSVWWKNFWCWCFYLPLFLFFVMFAVIFIGSKDKFPSVGNASVAGLIGNDFLFYGLSLAFLIYGMAQAKKLSCASGTGVSAVFGKIEAGVRKYAPGAAYVRGGVAGLKERGAEIQEKGILGVGGAQRARLQEATAKGFVAGIPGPGQVPGAREAVSRAQAAEVEKEVKRLQTLNLTLDQLNERLTKASGPEKIAALKLKAENGWLDKADAEEIAKTVRTAGGGKTTLGASVISSLKKGKFHEMAASTKDKEDVFNKFITEDSELAKAFGLDMAESKEVMDRAVAEKLLGLYEGDTKEMQDKIAKAVSDNVENFAKDKSARERIINTVITPATTAAQKKLMALTGKIMADKKDVADWKTRRRILELNGGIDPAIGEAKTADGKKLLKDMDDNNTGLKEEAKFRKTRAIDSALDLTRGPGGQYEALETEIITNVKSGFIGSFSTEELKTPVIFNALVNAKISGALTTDQFNKAIGLVKSKGAGGAWGFGKGKPDRKKREAINALKTAVSPMPYP